MSSKPIILLSKDFLVHILELFGHSLLSNVFGVKTVKFKSI